MLPSSAIPDSMLGIVELTTEESEVGGVSDHLCLGTLSYRRVEAKWVSALSWAPIW